MQIDTSSVLDSGYMYDIGRIGCSKTYEKASREAAVKSRSDGTRGFECVFGQC